MPASRAVGPIAAVLAAVVVDGWWRQEMSIRLGLLVSYVCHRVLIAIMLLPVLMLVPPSLRRHL